MPAANNRQPWIGASAVALLLLAAVAWRLVPGVPGPDLEPCAANIASLIDPAKLATLGARGANPRLQKSVYWLARSAQAGGQPNDVAQRAVQLAGYTNAPAAQLTQAALVENLQLAGQHGCLDEAGLAEMRRGRSPTIKKGEGRGQELTVDHIIPLAVAPEVGNVIANLTFLPGHQNSSKRDKIEAVQVDLARKLHRAGLLSDQGLSAVQGRAQ